MYGGVFRVIQIWYTVKMKYDLKIVLYHLVQSLLFVENFPISQIPQTTGSRKVFCVFLNQEMRYNQSFDTFRVLPM